MNSLEAMNICLACPRAGVNFRASNLSGPNRSIVRRIASKLPLGPAKRFYIHAFEVGHLRNKTNINRGNNIRHPIGAQWHPSLELIELRKRSDSGISSSSECDLLWHAPDLVTVADVPRLIHERSSLDIRLRCEHCFPLSPNPVSEMEVGAVNVDLAEPLPQTTSAATDRILELESELAKLRQQLAAIVRVQEQGTASVDFTYLPPGMTSSPISSASAGGPPPPPPPPPPPLPVTPAVSIADIIRKNRAKSSSCHLVASHNKPSIDMTEILKDIGKIRLRQIARSPGGTPFRQNVDSREANDTASFIANALKRKFAKVHQDRKENQSFSSPDDRSSCWSPIADNNPTPPGPHLLKSRRSHQLKPLMPNLCQLEVVAE